MSPNRHRPIVELLHSRLLLDAAAVPDAIAPPVVYVMTDDPEPAPGPDPAPSPIDPPPPDLPDPGPTPVPGIASDVGAY